jgi:hypothetical protein
MSGLITHEKFFAVEISGEFIKIRTACSLKELITELILRSGVEIAFLAEGEAARCAQRWRDSANEEGPIG